MVTLIVGLGNPGTRFAGTRHNVGIEVVRAWADALEYASDWQVEKQWPAEVAECRLGQKRWWVMFPLTFMNESGVAVAKFMQKKAVEVNELVVVHDDLELPLGEVKWKDAGSAAGHKGVRSIQERLGSQHITRLRLGIGRPPEQMPVERFVLQKFLPEEREIVDLMIARAREELDAFILQNGDEQ